jgi:uncharacterized membrane protein SirB2
LSLYATLKLVHVTAVVLSGAGFVTRYVRAVTGRPPARGWLRAAPHVVDSALLASALGLTWIGGFRPLEVPWLEAKLVGLALYIVAGTIALKHGRTAGVRATAFALALLAYAWIVSVALTKHPHGWLAGGLA